MELLARRGRTCPQWLTNLLKPKREYPLVDFAILVYVAFTISFQVLLQISPFVTWLATTPIYSMQTYLGILGGGLIVVDLFTTKKIWQGRYAWLLYGILVLAALASVRVLAYGVKENIFKLCWAAVQYVLVYSCIYRVKSPEAKKWATTLFYVLLGFWVLCCGISLYQYINQIGYRYVVNPLSADASSNRQGFIENRLFGVFYTLNHSAYISLLFLLISFLLTLKQKRKWVKAVLIICQVTLFSHIVLTYSRSTFISMTLSVALLAWFFLRKKFADPTWRKRALALGLSVLTAGVFWLGLQGYKTLLTYLPTWHANVVCFVQVHLLGNPDYPFAVNIPEYNEEILDRDYLEADQSNGRLSIWADYVSLYKEVGPVGLSPGSYMAYIADNHPDLYIVDYIRNEYPTKLDSGIIYHTHNGYLLVYVSAGILGALCLAAFMVLCLKKVFCTIAKHRCLPTAFVGAFLIVLVCAVSAVFDEGLFFQNSPYTTLFWFSLGFLLKKCGDLKAQTSAVAEENNQ